MNPFPRISILLVSLALAAGAAACDKKKEGDGGGSASSASSERDKVPEHREGQMYWLGKELGLAAVGYANGASQRTVDDAFKMAATIADVTLETKLEPLPARTGEFAEDGATALHYLLQGPGRTIGEKVNAEMGEAPGAAYELALKLSMLGILYTGDPEDQMADTMAEVFERLSARAKLPPEVLAPLITKLKARAPIPEVMDLAIKAHKDVPAALEATYGKKS